MRVRPGRAEARPSIQAANWRRVQIDSVFIGIVTASGTFLPVFLLRLGASGNDLDLLTALPALTAFILAIPLGRWLQGRRNIVPWYSRLRLVAWASYAVIVVVAAVLPREQAIPVTLAVWALASLPSTAGLVAFPMVMDGAASAPLDSPVLAACTPVRRWGPWPSFSVEAEHVPAATIHIAPIIGQYLTSSVRACRRREGFAWPGPSSFSTCRNEPRSLGKVG